MKKIDLGQTINSLANVGVLIGIVFLAVELRQSSRIGQAQSRAQIASEAADHILRRAENPQLEDILIRADAGEDLTVLEQQLLSLLLLSQFRRWENIHYQYRQGLYSEAEFAGNVEAWRRIFSSNGVYRQHWEQSRNAFSPEFATDIDRLLSATP